MSSFDFFPQSIWLIKFKFIQALIFLISAFLKKKYYLWRNFSLKNGELNYFLCKYEAIKINKPYIIFILGQRHYQFSSSLF